MLSEEDILQYFVDNNDVVTIGDDKMLRRKLRNRLSAANSRRRKQEYIRTLLSKVNTLEQEIDTLQKQNASLRLEIEERKDDTSEHCSE